MALEPFGLLSGMAFYLVPGHLRRCLGQGSSTIFCLSPSGGHRVRDGLKLVHGIADEIAHHNAKDVDDSEPGNW